MIKFSYIHIPFCSKKCKYCAFTSFINLNYIEKYISSLIKQIEKAYDGTPQKTLYFGGGTPSLLSIKQIETIIKKFNFDKNPEITFEINPENADKNYLKELFDLGINRLSTGIQTFNDEILNIIGRGHTSYQAHYAIENALQAGFKNISIDLMYGLPYETISIWENDLKIANSLDITHISTYGLKIEDGTYFSKFYPKNLPDDDVQAEMYKISIEKLTNFKLYEISNFAKSEQFQSQHNLNYWNLTPYNGFGISASGFDLKTRYTNTNSIQKYFENPCLKDEIIKTTEKSLIEEMIFLGFRKIEGIDISKFDFDFNKKYADILDKYIKSGHIIKTKKGYKLSIDGILISNYILSDFLW